MHHYSDGAPEPEQTTPDMKGGPCVLTPHFRFATNHTGRQAPGTLWKRAKLMDKACLCFECELFEMDAGHVVDGIYEGPVLL